MRHMDAEASESYDVVIDKGTLDAISSHNEDEPAHDPHSLPSRDAADYMTEIWRVLRVNGAFLVVTTMPPAIFERFVIDALNECAESGHDWTEGHSQHCLTTAEGGTVFYYAIRKRSGKVRKQAQLLAAISNLLNEAKKIAHVIFALSTRFDLFNILHMKGDEFDEEELSNSNSRSVPDELIEVEVEEVTKSGEGYILPFLPFTSSSRSLSFPSFSFPQSF